MPLLLCPELRDVFLLFLGGGGGGFGLFLIIKQYDKTAKTQGLLVSNQVFKNSFS